jgi:hypothetical protein
MCYKFGVVPIRDTIAYLFAKPKFSVGQHVRISKENMKFANGLEQNYSTEIFKIVKVIRRIPTPLYGLQDLNSTAHPLTARFIRKKSPDSHLQKHRFKINKILSNGVQKAFGK